jgi:hypothetical protein
MDFFQSQPAQAVAILPSSIFPERSIALENDWLVHQKELKLIPTLHANKSTLQGSTHSYIDGLLSVAPTVPKLLLSYLLPVFRTFNCTSKTIGWFTKRAEIDPNLVTLTKKRLQGNAFLYTWMDLFSVASNCAQVAIFTFFHILNVHCQ